MIILHRAYAKHTQNGEYTRRISWISQNRTARLDGKQKVAVAEFLGKFPDRVPHLMAVAKSVVDATFEKKCDNGKG